MQAADGHAQGHLCNAAVSSKGTQAAGGGASGEAGGERGLGREEGPELVHGINLQHDFQLASVDGLATPFTNYVRGCARGPGFSFRFRFQRLSATLLEAPRAKAKLLMWTGCLYGPIPACLHHTLACGLSL